MEQQLEAFDIVESCIRNLSVWMFNNKLKLNDDKTEFLLVGSQSQRLKVVHNSIKVGEHTITTAPIAKNLGIWIDETLTLAHLVQQVFRSAVHQIFLLHKIRLFSHRRQLKYLSKPWWCQSLTMEMLFIMDYWQLSFINSSVFKMQQHN